MESENQTNGITLIPCPFCGGEADEYEGDYGNGIYCTMCGAMVGEPIHLEYMTTKRVSITEAIAAWNTRHVETCRVMVGATCGLYSDNPRKYFELSCGHSFTLDGLETPNYCLTCGRMVKHG